MIPLLLCTSIEHASSMYRYTSMLMQSIMCMAMESMSSAYTCAILHHRSLVHMHADTRAIIKTCRVVYGTAQFKLDKARVWHVLDTTRFSFCTRAGMCALERSMT